MDAILIILIVLIFAAIGLAWLIRRGMDEAKKDPVVMIKGEVYIVNKRWYVGKDAEKRAKKRASKIIAKGKRATVTIPGCESMDAETVWDI